MQKCAEIFPGYGFEAHVGYGTAQHKAALSRLGPCTLHRYSFSPVKQVSNK
jgi:ribonuclease HII